MKLSNIYKGKIDPFQNEFEHRFACWANNHNGWAKAKKANKRLAKRRIKNELMIDIDNLLYEELKPSCPECRSKLFCISLLDIGSTSKCLWWGYLVDHADEMMKG